MTKSKLSLSRTTLLRLGQGPLAEVQGAMPPLTDTDTDTGTATNTNTCKCPTTVACTIQKTTMTLRPTSGFPTCETYPPIR